ncbi:hypothetical protein [Salsipaludibacter albus]|uniref:hypothetical protein n=1 Tax=Salsipaludibacter albus TaxID=2849650 RepID=UPI001EE3E7EA|nr:hypothetical protein [Salsipaludibacter albus]MBY5162556.1 hypothetical protein [Salsipaludibacter albus]
MNTSTVPPDASTGSVPPAPRLATTSGPRSPAQLWALLRDRLPELLATTGTALLVAAVTGFVVSQWRALDNVGQAGLLVAGSVVLTLQGQWASSREGRLVRRLVPLSWAAAVGLTLVAVQLLAELGLPATPRLGIALAGVVAMAHAAWAWRQRPGSILLQVVTVACALYAVGPLGAALSDTWGGVDAVAWLAVPAEALFGITGSGSDVFAVVAIGHLVVGVAWLAVGLQLPAPAAARTGRIGGSLVLAVAACELNAMSSPIGSSLALLVVVGFLLVGLALRDGLLIGFGSMAALVTGLRTTWSLFSGETAVTVTVATAGVVALLAALRLGRARDEHDDAREPDDAPSDAAPASPAGRGPGVASGDAPSTSA